MIWRTDKPTEKVIVAKLTEDFCHIKDNYSLLYLTDKPYQHYCEYGEEIPYSAIEKWASLEDKLPSELDEAADKYAHSLGYDEEKERLEIVSAKEDFIAGAEYQRKQDQQLIELAEDHAMLAGMNKMKEQMMEEAVDGRVIKSYNPVTAIGQPTLHGIELIYPDKDKPYLVAGDKVKIIVIPEKSEKVK